MTTNASASALVDRINLGSLPLADALHETVALYRDDPLFCIPAPARDLVARFGDRTKFVLLGSKTFSEVFIRALPDKSRILGVVDDFKAVKGECHYGVDYLTTEQFLKLTRDDPSVLALNSCRTDYSRRFFERLCRDHGIAHVNHEQATRLLGMNALVDYRTADWGPTIGGRFDEFFALEQRLADPYSVETLRSVLMFHLTCNPEWYLGVARPYSTLYFRSGMLSFSDREKFVDCGASIGESTTALLGITQDRIGHAWMIEPDRLNLGVLRDFQNRYAGTALEGRITLHPHAVGETRGEVPFHHLGGHGGSIEVTPDVPPGGIHRAAPRDKVTVLPIDAIIDDVPTLIKMDIEGYELPALRGARKAIQAGLPKMAVSAYHRATDLLDLPACIDSIAPGYSVGLRHHTEDRWDTCLYFYR